MSIWLEAARKARCQTDRTDKTDRTAKTPLAQPDLIQRQSALSQVPSVLSVRQFEGKPDPGTAKAAPPARGEVLSVLSVRQFRGESYSRPADLPRAKSITGSPKAWTGRVVSLDEWRRLSAWDRHGPDGRMWCGICQAWVAGFPDCHGGDA